MKPADNENKNDRKLFIGKVPKTIKEAEIRATFGQYGTIEECIILKDNTTGASKGCAFVTYNSRAMALAAIKATHQTKVLEGCQQPLVVKFADQGTPPKKAGTALLNGNSVLSGGNSNGNANNLVNVALASQLYGPAAQAAAGVFPNSVNSFPVSAYSPALLDSISYFNLLKTQQHHQQQQQAQQQLEQAAAAAAAASSMFPFSYTTDAAYQTGANTLLGASGVVTPTTPPATVVARQPLFAGSSLLSTPAVAGKYLPNAPLAATAAGFSLTATGPTAAATSLSPFAASLLGKLNGRPLPPDLLSGTSPVKQTEGPEGANLFIYHLPGKSDCFIICMFAFNFFVFLVEYGDTDLIGLFAPFGQILSAKVFIDKNSNLSKCFGFVSFDNVESAQTAIRTMNGFQVLNKRLKVQPKKVRDKPY